MKDSTVIGSYSIAMTDDTPQLAHRLIDRLPQAQLSGLVQFLKTIVNPVTAALPKAPLEVEALRIQSMAFIGK